MTALYDTIGQGYSTLRKPDDRIAAQIHAALGPAQTVVNIGAGTGSYEPADRKVTAVEPSLTMIRQRPKSEAAIVQCSAEALPFEDKSFDASMAVLTIHHWSDRAKGLAEMRRVTRDRMVIVTFDPDFSDFWLLDYFPELKETDKGRMPGMAELRALLGPGSISPLLIPQDCTDGFVAAYWKRPEAYLDELVRAAMSPFRLAGDVSAGLDRLVRDLETGEWHARHADLLRASEMDCGYRLVEVTP
ncbi:MAG: class I SAM-dependent methyltransferase [Nitratireductor sp.]|nr:class I SAM-dependent methyltransferase [Nitratireductor sp.]